MEEARRAALEELVPAAVKSLQAHLGDGDPAAWRAALRVFAHAFGRPAEQATATEDLTLPTNAWTAQNLTWTQLQAMAARVLDAVDFGGVLCIRHVRCAGCLTASRRTTTGGHAPGHHF